MDMRKESELESRFARYVESRGGLCLKLVDAHRNGFPDRTVIRPDGSILFIEFKRNKYCRPRASQLEYIATLFMQRQEVFVVDDFDVAVSLFEETHGERPTRNTR